MIHEFVLSVTHLQDQEYLIRTEKVEPYVPLAEERQVWNIEQWLEEAQTLMNDPILLLLKSQDRNSKSSLFFPKKTDQEIINSHQSLITFGQKLYSALFFGTIRESLITAQSLAQSQKKILRLRLALKHEPLLIIPWEVIHPTGTDIFRPLVTGTEVAFSRYHYHKFVKNKDLIKVPEPNQPLEILMVISSPNDQEKLALKEEVKHLEMELNPQTNCDQKIILKILENPGREELTQTLERGNYQVFHYAGHSDISNTGGDIYLVNQMTGLTESLSGEDLAGLLANNKIQLAVFNSCRSAHIEIQGEFGQEANLTYALVKRGIPAVLAMVGRIPDQVALTFSRLVYRNLNLGLPIDLSLSRARQGLISAYGSNQLYWALPVLYLHPEFNGVLINTEKSHDRDPAWYYSVEEDEQFWEDLPESKVISQPSIEPSDKMIVKSILEEIKQEKDHEIKIEKKEPSPVNDLSTIKPLNPLKVSNLKQYYRNIKVLTIGCLTLIIGVFVSLWYINTNNNLKNQIQSNQNTDQPLNLDEVDLSNVTAIAIEKFSEQNLEQGCLAVQKLLDNGSLSHAKSALTQVDPTQLNDPEVNFLFGRLAWQYYWDKNSDYSLDDARRYWELAVKENPDQIKYYNALAFAYYAENQLERANNLWFKALDLINLNADQTLNQDSLNTLAGLALGLKKSAKNYSGKKKEDLINQAINYREKVIKNDALKFKPEALATPENWIWFESAINDWQSFLEIKSQ